MADFKEITTMKYWCQKVLPLVYDDSLSYYEVLGKVVNKLNDLIKNNEQLPEYISNLIQQYISSGAIGEVVRNILTDFMLNVKNPPNDLKPAVGDGSADDTEAIQGCIDYASANGGMCVYFPSGSYLTKPLTIKDNVSLFGFDRYNTKLVLRGGATQGLLTGYVEDFSISGMTLDGNMDIQVNNINLIDMNVDSVILSNMVLTDGYTLVRLTVNKILQMDNLVFDYSVVKHMELSGSGSVSANNIYMHDISALKGECLLELQNNNSTFTNMFALGDTPLGYKIAGNNNSVSGVIRNATVPYTDTGSNNSITVVGVTESVKMTGDYKVESNNHTETLKGKKVVTAESSDETITQGKTITVGGDLIEHVTGNHRNHTTGYKEEEINGRRVTMISGFDNTTALGSTENYLGKKTLIADEIILESAQPLGYKEPVAMDEFFKYVSFKHNDTPYQVLVKGKTSVKESLDNLNTRLNEETQEREAAISNEITARENADNQLRDDITTEKEIREQAVSTLNTKIETETNERIDKDNEILDKIKNNLYYVNVKDFGVIGDGVVDDTANINIALEYLKSIGGGTLFFPTGDYLISSSINLNTDGLSIMGTGIKSTRIISTSPTDNIIKIGAVPTKIGCGVENVQLCNKVGRTSGYAIYVDGCENYKLDNILVYRYNDLPTGNGMYFGSNCGLGFISNIDCEIKGNFCGIRVNGSNDRYFSKLWIRGDAVSSGSVGIEIQASGGDWFTDVESVQFNEGVVISPPVGSTVAWCKFHNVLSDTNILLGFRVGGAGGITGLNFNSCWCSTNGLSTINGRGMKLTNGTGIIINDLRAINNGGHGLEMGTNVSNVQISGGIYSGNSHAQAGVCNGLSINTDGFRITDIQSSEIFDSVMYQQHGLHLIQSCTNYIVSGNDFRHNIGDGVLNETTPDEVNKFFTTNIV